MPTYCERVPTVLLSPWVECVWALESETAVVGYPVRPDACLDILYERGRGLRAIGAMTSQQRFDLAPGACLVGVRFRPGMASSFLGVSAVKLTDGSTSLPDLWSHRARELTRQMDDARSVHESMHRLLANLPVPTDSPNPVQRAIEALVNARGNAGLPDLARQANLSERQFRRRCLDESGLTPKLLSRILRFRHACQLAHAAARPNWSAIAAASQYFDQAHLIRDFREFSDTTPVSVFSNTDSNEAHSLEA